MEEKNEKNDYDQVAKETELIKNKLYHSFQLAAEAVAKVYTQIDDKERLENFKSAARATTSLYRDSLETTSHLATLSLQKSQQQTNKNLIQFLRKSSSKYIRKDELINFLLQQNQQHEPLDNNLELINEQFSELFKSLSNGNKKRKRSGGDCSEDCKKFKWFE